MLKNIWLLFVLFLIFPSLGSAKSTVWQQSLKDMAGSKGASVGWYSGQIYEENNSIVIKAELSCGKKWPGTMSAKGVMKVSLKGENKPIVNKLFSCNAGGPLDGKMNKGTPDRINTTLLGYTAKDLKGGQVDFVLIAREKNWWKTTKSSWEKAVNDLMIGVKNDVSDLVRLGAQAISTIIH